MAIKDYIYQKNIFNKKTWLAILFGIFFLGGLYGFVYETIFYYINNGALTRRGTCFGPWIDIYGFGALLIFAVGYKLRKKPWLVFLLSGLSCGILEYVMGYIVYQSTGYRSWNYNTEIWSWGSIGGFVCLRSVTVFAVSGLLLIYVMIPVMIRLYKKIGEGKFFVIMTIFGMLFFVDFFYNDIFTKFLPLTNAIEFYGRSGWYPIVTGYTGG